MSTFLDSIRSDFAEREENLKVFEIFSGTGTPGENGNPKMPSSVEDADNPEFSLSEGLAFGTFGALGLTGASYITMQKTAPDNKLETIYEPMKITYEKIQIGKALEAAQSGKGVTKLMELLPNIGTAVKRLNIDALWGEVEDALKILELSKDKARLGIEMVDNSMESVHNASKAAFVGFGAISGLGVAATAATAAFHDRAVPFLEDIEKVTAKLDKWTSKRVETAYAELEQRSETALGDLDAKLAQIERLSEKMPDFDGIADLFAEVEAFLAPIDDLNDKLAELVDPYEGFLDVAKVIGAPIEAVLYLFENPPKVVPTIIGYETITPGFWLTVPDPTWSNPFRTKKVWVDPVKVPIPGFKEIFNPIPRDEVQKIIDLVLNIAGLPLELLEKALAPILKPIEKTINSFLQPILEKLNPFDDFIKDFDLTSKTLEELAEKLVTLLDSIEAALKEVEKIDLDLSPIEEIGAIKKEGMATYFGTDAAEEIVGQLVEGENGSMEGAVLQGNGGHDKITGTKLNDLLGGGAGKDDIRGEGGSDVLIGGGGADELRGGAGRDVLLGGKGADELRGADGNDRAYGGDGSDLIFGGSGKDFLRGNKGNDTLDGGAGADKLAGGRGADVFVFGKNEGPDRVLDFEDGVDMLQVEGVRFRDLDITQNGDDTEIRTEDDLIATLRNVDADLLSQSDFIFN